MGTGVPAVGHVEKDELNDEGVDPVQQLLVFAEITHLLTSHILVVVVVEEDRAASTCQETYIRGAVLSHQRKSIEYTKEVDLLCEPHSWQNLYRPRAARGKDSPTTTRNMMYSTLSYIVM